MTYNTPDTTHLRALNTMLRRAEADLAQATSAGAMSYYRAEIARLQRDIADELRATAPTLTPPSAAQFAFPPATFSIYH